MINNAEALGLRLKEGGLRLVSGGTDNHMVLVDLTPMDISGKQAEESLGRANIVVNRNAIPFDKKPPRQASGMRLGTPSVTTRGMDGETINIIGDLILEVINNLGDNDVEKRVKNEVLQLTRQFPVPGVD